MAVQITKICIITILSITISAGCIMQTLPPMTIHIGHTDYTTIQDAINAADNDAIIYVDNGVYYETITINKPLTIIGENTNLTIIDGTNNDNTIYISKDRVNINGFTIRNTNNTGINIHSSYNNITNNNISNNKYGIYSSHSQHNNFSHNTFFLNTDYGIYFHSGSDNNIISDNNFSSNSCGLRIKASYHNEVSRNLFTHNQDGIYLCCASQHNTAFHNIFMNNTQNAYDWVDGNQWDNGREGNYYDDYTGVDENNDGIGDTPYIIRANTTRQDNYPLMNNQ